MKKKIMIFLALISLLGCSNNPAVTNNYFTLNESFYDWTNNYYKTNDTKNISDAIIYFTNLEDFEESNAKMPFISFFSEALKNNDLEQNEIYERLSVHSNLNTKLYYLDILWYIDSQNSTSLYNKASNNWEHPKIKKEIQELSDIPKFDLVNMADITGLELDMMWNSFYATGDQKFIIKIIKTSEFSITGNDMAFIFGSAAKWSLKSNINQHKLVKEICIKYLNETENENIKNILKEIL